MMDEQVRIMKPWLYDWNGANVEIFKTINQIQGGPLYDQFMLLGSKLAWHHYFPLYLIILGVLCVLAGIRRKIKAPAAMPWLRGHLWCWGSMFAVLVISYGVDGLLLSWLKPALHFPRPFQILPQGTFRMIDSSFEIDQLFRSFPSGHASFATVMAAGIWPILNRSTKPIAVFFVLWACISRIVLGVHFPADVVAGVLFSLIIVLTVRKVWFWTFKQFSKEAR